MTTLSHTTGYAIEALACLAGHGADSMRVGEIARATGLPSPYLSKVFQRLCDAGIVGTKRGYKGGVRLTRAPGAISLLEIDAAVEGGRVCGPAEVVPAFGTFWEAFHQSYVEKLAALTLADVIDYETRTRGKPA